MSETSSSTTASAPRPRRPLGVVVVDPLPVVRAGLVCLLSGGTTEVLAEAGTAEEAVRAVARVRRSRVVVLVSLGLEEPHDGPWLLRELRDRYPFHALLAVGANADPTTISRALFFGADGFVDKRVDPPKFLESVLRAGDHGIVLAGPGPIAVGDIAEGIERRRVMDVLLTPREREVLAVAAEGLTAREIASRLGVRERTVTTHLGRIYSKLGVGSRLAAVRIAARSGLVSVGGPE